MLPGACWSRLAAGRAGTLGPRPAAAVGSTGGRSTPPGPAVHQSEQRFSPAVGSSSAQEFAGGRSPGQRVAGDPERSVFQQRLSSSPARSAPYTEGRPGLQNPGAVQARPEAPGESPPGEQQSAIAALPGALDGRSAGASP